MISIFFFKKRRLIVRSNINKQNKLFIILYIYSFIYISVFYFYFFKLIEMRSRYLLFTSIFIILFYHLLYLIFIFIKLSD